MSRINILVATTSRDIKADAIAESVTKRPDMQLLENCVLPATAIENILGSLPSPSRCALVLVGRPVETSELAQRFLAQRDDVVVLEVDIVGKNVQIGLRDPRLQAILDTLRDLAERMSIRSTDRIAQVRLETDRATIASNGHERKTLSRAPLLQASFNWVNAVLRDAVEQVPEDDSELHGLTLTRATVLRSLDSHARTILRRPDEGERSETSNGRECLGE